MHANSVEMAVFTCSSTRCRVRTSLQGSDSAQAGAMTLLLHVQAVRAPCVTFVGGKISSRNGRGSTVSRTFFSTHGALTVHGHHSRRRRRRRRQKLYLLARCSFPLRQQPNG